MIPAGPPISLPRMSKSKTTASRKEICIREGLVHLRVSISNKSFAKETLVVNCAIAVRPRAGGIFAPNWHRPELGFT